MVDNVTSSKRRPWVSITMFVRDIRSKYKILCFSFQDAQEETFARSQFASCTGRYQITQSPIMTIKMLDCFVSSKNASRKESDYCQRYNDQLIYESLVVICPDLRGNVVFRRHISPETDQRVRASSSSLGQLVTNPQGLHFPSAFPFPC